MSQLNLHFHFYIANVLRRHTEGPSTALGTALNYAAIRVLGMRADHPVAVKARKVLHKLGNSVFPTS